MLRCKSHRRNLARRDIPQAGIVLIDECHLRMKALETWMDSEEWAKVPFVAFRRRLGARYGRPLEHLLKPTSIAELIARTERGELAVFCRSKSNALRFQRAPIKSALATMVISARRSFRVYDQREIVANVIETWLKEAPGEATRSMAWIARMQASARALCGRGRHR